MPIVRRPIPDIYDTVSRPIISSVLAFIFENTRLPKDAFINYPGLWEQGKQPGSTLDENPIATPRPDNLEWLLLM